MSNFITNFWMLWATFDFAIQRNFRILFWQDADIAAALLGCSLQKNTLNV
jgi:hypothetical protein